MAGTVIDSDPSATDYNLLPQLESVAKPPSDMKSKIECPLADLTVLTKNDIEAIVESLHNNWNNTLQSQIVKSFKSTFEYALQALYFSLNNGLKFAMFSVA